MNQYYVTKATVYRVENRAGQFLAEGDVWGGYETARTFATVEEARAERDRFTPLMSRATSR